MIQMKKSACNPLKTRQWKQWQTGHVGYIISTINELISKMYKVCVTNGHMTLPTADVVSSAIEFTPVVSSGHGLQWSRSVSAGLFLTAGCLQFLNRGALSLELFSLQKSQRS